jgi:dienelactone hydrolase
MTNAVCHFGQSGWNQWPDSDDLSAEFLRHLGAAQEGGSTVSECFLTASRIDPKDQESWYREWNKMAVANHERGNAALSSGNFLTAQSRLRALSYYNVAVFNFDFADKRLQAALANMRTCARRCLKHRTPPGEVVEIPWLSHYPLEGYFLAAPAASAQTPVVICIGEPGHRKEEYLYKTARYARDRGMSLLAVDLLGSDNGAQFENVVGRPDLEMAVSYIMEYLTTRDDVDKRRIAILGDGSGSFVARGVALDHRFAAAVCDGGIWDLQERAFLANHIAPRDAAGIPASLTSNGVAPNLKCPVLITIGEHGWLEPERVNVLIEQLKTAQSNITLKIFTGAETAASQGHADNPTLANEFIFDWIADRLECNAVQTHNAHNAHTPRSDTLIDGAAR